MRTVNQEIITEKTRKKCYGFSEISWTLIFVDGSNRAKISQSTVYHIL